MPIGFLNPALLLGLLGAGVPVLVHLLGRRQARSRAFAAIDFLLQSEKRLATRRRLRHLLLLLARIALIAAVVLALARPLFRGGVVAGSGQPVSAIMVLDKTASMSVMIGSQTAFERAKSLLVETLIGLPSGSEACVVTIEARPRRLTPGFVTTDEAIRQLRLVSQGWSAGFVADAFAEVEVVASSARRSTAIVYVASDLQETTWSRFTAPEIGGRSLQLFVIDAAAEGVGVDIGLVAADVVAGEAALAIRGIRSATVTAAPSTQSDQVIELRVGGQLINRGMLAFGDQDSTATQLALPPAPADSTAAGSVAEVLLVSGGSMTVNDRRFVYLEPSHVVRVLLADGSPHADLQQDEVFYLERALQADSADLAVRVVDASTGSWSDRSPVDVVVLANVARLDSAMRRRLEQHVEAGGGLLVTAGETVTGSTLTTDLGALLPAVIKAGSTSQRPDRTFTIDLRRSSNHPILEPFESSQSAQSLTAAVFRRALEVEPTADASLVLTFDTGIPALVEARRGNGRVMLWTSTIDRGWNDLAVKPAYVPLVGRIVRYLGGGLEPARTRHWHVDVPIALRADPTTSRDHEDVRFRGPDGVWIESTQPRPDSVEIELGVAEPGAYLGYVRDRRVAEFDFVANLDPSESNHTRIAPDNLREQLGADAAVSTNSSPDAHREDEAALPVLILVALAILLEAVVGRRRRVEKAAV